MAANPANLPPTRRRVRLIDATCLGQVGRGGDAWRVHWDHDLSAGRLGSVVVTDPHGGEHLDRFALAPDDIIVADNSYGYRRSVALARAAGAEGVFRIYPPTFPGVEVADRAAPPAAASAYNPAAEAMCSASAPLSERRTQRRA